jgi:patatin-like phospholipase/acyl hydrolase
VAYHILSLDGGGIRGVFTTELLSRLEAVAPFLAKVDLFAGTSTGGIIALGLAAGLTPDELTSLYLALGPEIFPPSPLGPLAILGKLVCAPYDNAALKRALMAAFGSRNLRTLGDLRRRVLVPTFDLDSSEGPASRQGGPRTWKPKFFHNFPGPGSDAAAEIVDVALRTSAAPTYFPTYQGFVDGGVIANNPSMVALAQALHPATGGQKLEDVSVLSLGTGDRLRFIAGPTHDWGYAQWAVPLSQLIVEGPMDTARYECEQLLGERFWRLDAVLDRDIDLDDAAAEPDLVALARRIPLEGTADWVRRHFA